MPKTSAGGNSAELRKNVAKTCRVNKGAYKSLLARIIGVKEKENVMYYELELLAKLKKITLEVSKTTLVDEYTQTSRGESNREGSRYLEDGAFVSQTPRHMGGQTPRMGADTPRAAESPGHEDEEDPFLVNARELQEEPASSARRTNSRFSSADNSYQPSSLPAASTNSYSTSGWGDVAASSFSSVAPSYSGSGAWGDPPRASQVVTPPPILSGGWGNSTVADWGSSQIPSYTSPVSTPAAVSTYKEWRSGTVVSIDRGQHTGKLATLDVSAGQVRYF